MTDAPGKEIPLSYPQQLLRLLEILRPNGGRSMFTMTMQLVIDGPLDLRALDSAFGEVVTNHESLRTRLVMGRGLPFQQVLPAPDGGLLTVHDTCIPSGDLNSFFKNTQFHEFDLDRTPLLAGHVIPICTEDSRSASSRHALNIIVHHSAADGWSMPLLEREIVRSYTGQVTGIRHPPPAWQYADFTMHQQRTMTRQNLAPDLEFWRDRLAGMRPPLIPTLRKPVDASPIKHSLQVPIGESVRAGLAKLCRDERATPFMAWLTCHVVILSALTGTSDILVPTITAGRHPRETEDVVGFFLNTLPLRVHVDSDATLADALRAVRATCLGAYAHQNIPFLELVENIDDLGLALADDRFVVLPFQHMRASSEASSIEFGPSCRAHRMNYSRGRAGELALPVDGLFTVREGVDTTLTLDYGADLFSAAGAQQLTEETIRLAGWMANDPRMRVRDCVRSLELTALYDKG